MVLCSSRTYPLGKKALRATAHFNEELICPSECDIVLGVLWHRLGTPLPSQFDTEDGRKFDSGTEWEIVEAFDGYKKSFSPNGTERAKPDIWQPPERMVHTEQENLMKFKS